MSAIAIVLARMGHTVTGSDLKESRALVRAMPTVVRRTLGQLAQQTRQGRPVTAQQAALTLARNTQRVLSSPQARRAVLQRSLAGNRAYHQIHRGRPGWRGFQGWNGPRPTWAGQNPGAQNPAVQNWGNWGGYVSQAQRPGYGVQPQYSAPGWDASPPSFQGQGASVQAGRCCPVCGTRR